MKPFFNFKRSRFSRELKRMAKENAAQGKPLCILDDLVFKAMLTQDTEDSREAIRCLLSACTHRQITDVRIVNNELLPVHLDAKTARLDVNVTFNDGEVADLEMQIGKSDDDLGMRSALYSAMLLSAQSKKGNLYKTIKRVYQIFFLNCVLYPQSSKLPRRYHLLEDSEHDKLTDIIEIIYYEMPKLEQRVRDILGGKIRTKTLSDEEKWCIYMKYRHEADKKSLITELCHEETGIMRTEKALSKVDRDFAKYMREMNIVKNRMDRASEKYYARQEGLTEGKAEGRVEGLAEASLEIAQKMKAMGDSTEKIHEITGLTIETIQTL